MTFPTVSRIFFAIDLPEAVRGEVNDYMSALKKKSRTNAIRWTKPENLHITLQFLPKAETSTIPNLVANVRKELEQAQAPQQIYLADIKLFPSPFRPRVIVLDVTPQSELSALAVAVGRGVLASDYEIDRRPYRGHLTLGRIKHTHGVNLQFLSAIPVPQFPAMPLNEIVLFRSQPQPDGTRYSVIDRISLMKS